MAEPMDAVDTYFAEKAKPAGSLHEAFVNTAKALQQFGVERIRVAGLSEGWSSCPADGRDPLDGIRVVSEQQFMREFVFLSRPCIILDAIKDWPAMQRWRSDRYLFDLDGHLPLVEQRSTSGDDSGSEGGDDEETKGESGCAPLTNEGQPQEIKEDSGDAAPRPLGPKRFTIALTPNGRADAVTHVLYDVRDVPDELKEGVYSGHTAQKAAVALPSHPFLTEEDEADRQHLRMEKLFMYAAEVKLTLPELYKLFLQGPKHVLDRPIYIDMRRYKAELSEAQRAAAPPVVVAYAQLQNNCLNTEFTHVHADITTNVEAFGTRVFGEAPEAANVWLGVPASVSSMHQDWVENLYPVVRGVKEFVLIPPWEGVFVPKPDIPSAAFSLDAGRCDRDSLAFAFKPFPAKDGTMVPWMDLDFTADLLENGGEEAALAALNERIAENEARKKPIQLNGALPTAEGEGVGVEEKKARELHPLVAYVHPGETLYLPAMWLHRVAQHADEADIRARARHLVERKRRQTGPDGCPDGEAVDDPPLPLIAAVNYWYNMSFTNPAVVMLREFGLLL